MNSITNIDKSWYHLFAWQGFSYEVPSEWNLAEYNIRDSVSCVRLQDDFGLRLEFEWVYVRRPVKALIIHRRYDKIASVMNRAGAVADNIEELPAGWSACLYSMSDGKRLLTAFRLMPDSNFFCLLKIHFESASKREAERIIRKITSTFTLYEQGLVPWAFYDISFHLHSDFKLVATSLLAGRKLLVFTWRGRRLYLFFFSLADILLQKPSMEKYCADYLNGFKAVSGVRFSAGENGTIVARPRPWRFWGNVEPIIRGCLRYQAWCRLIPDKNQIFLGVLNYRRHADLATLAASFDSLLKPDFD